MFIELSSPGLEIHAVFYSLTGIAQHKGGQEAGKPWPLTPARKLRVTADSHSTSISTVLIADFYPGSTTGKSIPNYWHFPMKPSSACKG